MITTKEPSMTLSELKTFEVVKPEWLGNRWVGIQHGSLAEAVLKGLDARGIKVRSQFWKVAGRYDGKLVAGLQLTIPDHKAPEGTTFALGLRHSNLGDQALKMAVGAHVFVCSNGMISGDWTVSRKHTKNVNLNDVVDIGLDEYMGRLDSVKETIESMKARGLATSDVDRILMAAGREGLLPWSRIGQVDEEYRQPTFKDHAEKTAWGLYNAFTYIVQKCPPHEHIRSIGDFKGLVLAA